MTIVSGLPVKPPQYARASTCTPSTKATRPTPTAADTTSPVSSPYGRPCSPRATTAPTNPATKPRK